MSNKLRLKSQFNCNKAFLISFSVFRVAFDGRVSAMIRAMNILFAIALTTGILPRLYGLLCLSARWVKRAAYFDLYGHERRGVGAGDYSR